MRFQIINAQNVNSNTLFVIQIRRLAKISRYKENNILNYTQAQKHMPCMYLLLLKKIESYNISQ